jgi:ribonuclease HI
MTMPKEVTYADIDTAMDTLSEVLQARGTSYALGWLKGMMGSITLSSDIKLTKRQIKALEAHIQKNIGWASKD